MKGLELCRLFFEDNRRMLEGYEGIAAAGLCGSGSECFGFDDEVSRDHDFFAGFYIFLSRRDDEAFLPLSRAYAALPDEYLGIKRKASSAFSRQRGVIAIEDFLNAQIGLPRPPLTPLEWLNTPDWALAAAVNGKIFFDGNGDITRVRRELSAMPEEVRKKRIAARAALMAQAGQYNYARCLRHGERGAAMLAMSEFVKEAVHMVYLLNRRYMPFYKWCFRGMEELPLLSDLKSILEGLLAQPDERTVEEVCAAVVKEFNAQGLSDGSWSYLEPHAFEITRRIENLALSALHVMEG